MDEKKSITKEFLQLVTTVFTYAVLAMSILGWLIGDTAQEITTVFIIGNEGLSHQTIFALILFSAINSGLALLISRVFKNLMLLWQLIITMFVCLVTTGVLLISFRWLPLDSWTSWVEFAVGFVGLFIIASAILIIKTKLEDRRYEKLLSEYKVKQKEGGWQQIDKKCSGLQ